MLVPERVGDLQPDDAASGREVRQFELIYRAFNAHPCLSLRRRSGRSDGDPRRFTTVTRMHSAAAADTFDSTGVRPE